MNAVASQCALAPGGYGPIEATTQTLAATRKNGFTPMRSSRYRHKAAKSDITAASVIKHLLAASQDANGPQGKPNNAIAGGRLPTIAPSPCTFPDQKAWLTFIDPSR